MTLTPNKELDAKIPVVHAKSKYETTAAEKPKLGSVLREQPKSPLRQNSIYKNGTLNKVYIDAKSEFELHLQTDRSRHL